MKFREDAYDEAKSYVQAIEMLGFIEGYWKYDLPKSVLSIINSECYKIIEHYEEKNFNQILEGN